jgi:hypothetical protein
LALLCAALAPAHAQEFAQFSTKGRPGTQGVEVRVSHPRAWKTVPVDDPMAVAELRGPHGRLTAILQIGRGRPQADMASLCKPERAQTMLRDADARVTDVIAREHQGRPAFDLRYERVDAGTFVLARSVIVCLKDTRLVVSCGASGAVKATLAEIEPVCRQVLASLVISEE